MDVGLKKGVHNLWKQESLVDYTIVVDKQEFKVHKVVLASVSDHLLVTVCESLNDRMELEGLRPDAVEKFIELIYTGIWDIYISHAQDIHACAKYFQIQECSRKMIDVGLKNGIHNLWNQGLLVDYTIVVEEREFKVHKVILASVSAYFQAMMCGSMKESETGRVELKGLSADAVSKLLELIYTGSWELITQNTTDILECAVYFQIPDVIRECRSILIRRLSTANCMTLLSTFSLYSFDVEVAKVKEFVRSERRSVMEKVTPADVSYEGLQMVVEFWEKAEWDLFQFVRNWINVDIENRNVHINTLLSQIRFCLMEPGKLAEIKDMEVFKDSDSSWRTLVDNAEVYHALPMHLKVVENRTQNMARGQATPILIDKEQPKKRLKKNIYSRMYTPVYPSESSSLIKTLECVSINGIPVNKPKGIQIKPFSVSSKNDPTGKVFEANVNQPIEPIVVQNQAQGDVINEQTMRILQASGEPIIVLNADDLVEYNASPVSFSQEQTATVVAEAEIPAGIAGLAHYAKMSQNKVENAAQSMTFSTDSNNREQPKKTVMYTLGAAGKDWTSSVIPDAPELGGSHPIAVVVNNFMVICTERHTKQRWHLFDPFTKTWSEMPGMLTPKIHFALVYDAGKLYALGGNIMKSFSRIDSTTDGIEVYNFKTDAWSTFGKMPVAVADHAACVVDGCIYVSGGRTGQGDYSGTVDLHCLNLQTGAWKKKPPMSKKMKNHSMHMMAKYGSKVIFVLDDTFNITYFHPKRNEWSVLKPLFMSEVTHVYEWCPETLVLSSNNSLYLLNVHGITVSSRTLRRKERAEERARCGCRNCVEWDPDDEDEDNERLWCVYRGDCDSDVCDCDDCCNVSDESEVFEARLCRRWDFPDYGDYVTETQLTLPLPGDKEDSAKDFCGVLLTVPEHQSAPPPGKVLYSGAVGIRLPAQ